MDDKSKKNLLARLITLGLDTNVSLDEPSAIVEFDFIPKESDELSLTRGDYVLNIEMMPGGWWIGTTQSNGKRGLFPENFVRVLDDDSAVVVLRDKSQTQNRRCKVVYSYKQNNDDELTLAVGDIIEVLGEVEEGWWRGRLGNRKGVFPSNFVLPVESISPISTRRNSGNIGKLKASANNSREDLVGIGTSNSPIHFDTQNKDAPILPPKPVREMCKVLFPYDPVNDDELELVEGDIISILSKDLPDKGWWKGELRGKVGVFPDNFVVAIASDVSPSKNLHHIQKPERPPPATKMLTTNKTATTTSNNNNNVSNNNNQNSHRKDSFGSKDSLNDTGIIVGSVAAHRRSLESKSVDITEKPPRKTFDTKASSEIRKSLENLDDRKSTPPPVLSKKPSVPMKKSPTIGSAFSNLKQKVKSVENKLKTHDSMDGIGSSRVANTQVADSNEKGVVVERVKREELDFDQVERGEPRLQDMRANRVKAPKRRLPTGANSAISENSEFLNNGHSEHSYQESPKAERRTISLTPASAAILDEDLAKPRAREWEKHKVPWMDELKASQAKKTSPNIESKSPEINKHELTSTTLTSNSIHETVDQAKLSNDMSKSFSSSYVPGHKKSIENISNNFDIRSVAATIATSSTTTTAFTTAAVAISTTIATTSTNPINTNSNVFNNNNNNVKINNKKIDTGSSDINPLMTKSMSSLATKISITETNVNDDIKARPANVNIRSNNISPIINKQSKNVNISPDTSQLKIANSVEVTEPVPATTLNTSVTTVTSTNDLISIVAQPTADSMPLINHHHLNDTTKITELELRVNKLEKVVHSQSKTIEELIKLLKDESDKVKNLKTELDKYAQCVTQV